MNQSILPTPAPAPRRRGLRSAVALTASAALALSLVAGAPAAPAEAEERVVQVRTEALSHLDAYGGGLGAYEQWLTTVPGVDGVAVADSGAQSHAWPGSTWSGRAAASVDLAEGRLGVLTDYSLSVSGDGGFLDTNPLARATVVDTITLDRSATVVLRGRLTGSTVAARNDEVYAAWPRGGSDFDLAFRSTNPDDCYEMCLAYGEVHVEGAHTYDALDAGAVVPMDEAFEVQVALPAGTSEFEAVLESDLNGTQYGYDNKTLTSSAHLDYMSGATFEIVVPDDVVVSSGSGLLPIVGGQAPVGDVTAPVLALPSPIEVTGDAAGTVVAYSVSATDDSDPAPVVECQPASGSLFPLGQTVVHCSATDDAGNTVFGSFTVTVVEAIVPVEDKLAALDADLSSVALPNGARQRLDNRVDKITALVADGRIEEALNHLRILVDHLNKSVDHGEMSRTDADRLIAQAEAIVESLRGA